MISLFVLAWAALLASQPAPEVTWWPERPVQGHLFTVQVVLPDGERVRGVEGEAAGEPLHFRSTDDGWESLAAIPIDTEGALTLEIRVAYAHGSVDTLAPVVPVVRGDYRHEELRVAPRLGAPLDAEDQARLARDQARAREVSRQAHATPRLFGDTTILPRQDRVTSGFGNGRVFNGQVSSRHLGLDLDGEPGDTVYAAARGVVALVDDFLLAGRIVYLNHGSGLLSGYFHLSEQLVSQGDTVQAGAPIGRVGATGRVTGPHLHWVVRYGTVSVDPRSLPGLVPGAAAGG